MKDYIGNSDGAGDDQERRFIERWNELDNEGRLAQVLEIRKVQSGSDRKTAELLEQVKILQETVESVKAGKGDTALEGLTNEIATIRAERELLKRQTEMLQRAADHDIDPALAIRFAQDIDANSTFDLAVREIERRTSERVNEQLSRGDIPESSPRPSGLTVQQFNNMSPQERSRLPQAVQDEMFGKAVEEVL